MQSAKPCTYTRVRVRKSTQTFERVHVQHMHVRITVHASANIRPCGVSMNVYGLVFSVHAHAHMVMKFQNASLLGRHLRSKMESLYRFYRKPGASEDGLEGSPNGVYILTKVLRRFVAHAQMYRIRSRARTKPSSHPRRPSSSSTHPRVHPPRARAPARPPSHQHLRSHASRHAGNRTHAGSHENTCMSAHMRAHGAYHEQQSCGLPNHLALRGCCESDHTPVSSQCSSHGFGQPRVQ